LKDVPVTQPLVDAGRLMLGAVLQREDPADALVSAVARTLHDLPPGARVGSSAPRREKLLLATRSDLQIEPLRGNVDTRLSKLKAGACDAIILAQAGLNRLGVWDDAIMARLEPTHFVPAAAQGAIGLLCRGDDAVMRSLLKQIDHAPSRRAVEIERAIVGGLGCNCHSAIGVWADLPAAVVHVALWEEQHRLFHRVRTTINPESTAAAVMAQVVASLGALS
jgi:hydroxymethylbilane synthase